MISNYESSRFQEWVAREVRWVVKVDFEGVESVDVKMTLGLFGIMLPRCSGPEIDAFAGITFAHEDVNKETISAAIRSDLVCYTYTGGCLENQTCLTQNQEKPGDEAKTTYHPARPWNRGLCFHFQSFRRRQKCSASRVT